MEERSMMKHPKEIMGLDLIVLMKFGSHLYGTDNNLSDTDYKGIFLPTKEQILLGKIPKSVSWSSKTNNETKNSPDDVEYQVFSLHYFLELAMKGETVAIDMLHAPHRWEESVPSRRSIWHLLQVNRARFYTKSMTAFVGYCRKQAAKYGIKGSRIDAAEKVKRYLDQVPTQYRIKDLWDILPRGEHIHDDEVDKNGLRIYQVCGKKFQETCGVRYVHDVLDNFLNQYGHRARLAQKNEGVDWKAMSHACRAAYQVLGILNGTGIIYPLPIADMLKDIKQGKMDYQFVSEILEFQMETIEILVETSDLPEQVDRKWWENWLVSTLKNVHFGG
jgi:hypothetical protein